MAVDGRYGKALNMATPQPAAVTIMICLVSGQSVFALILLFYHPTFLRAFLSPFRILLAGCFCESHIYKIQHSHKIELMKQCIFDTPELLKTTQVTRKVTKERIQTMVIFMNT